MMRSHRNEEYWGNPEVSNLETTQAVRCLQRFRGLRNGHLRIWQMEEYFVLPGALPRSSPKSAKGFHWIANCLVLLPAKLDLSIDDGCNHHPLPIT